MQQASIGPTSYLAPSSPQACTSGRPEPTRRSFLSPIRRFQILNLSPPLTILPLTSTLPASNSHYDIDIVIVIAIDIAIAIEIDIAIDIAIDIEIDIAIDIAIAIDIEIDIAIEIDIDIAIAIDIAIEIDIAIAIATDIVYIAAMSIRSSDISCQPWVRTPGL